MAVTGGYSNAAMFFHASTRCLRAALSFRRPRARIVTTIVVDLCAFHNFVLLSDSMMMREESSMVASSSVGSTPIGGRSILWIAYPSAAGRTARYARSNAPSWMGAECPSRAVLRTSSRKGLRTIHFQAERIGHRVEDDRGKSKRRGDGDLA